jgi:hypothetical protein
VKNGGRRPGAGRKAGIKNKSTYEVKAIINSIIPAKERYGLLAELARGITVQEIDKEGGVRVYEKPPSEPALKILCEYADGKPAQSVDVTSGGSKIAGVVVEIIRGNNAS